MSKLSFQYYAINNHDNLSNVIKMCPIRFKIFAQYKTFIVLQKWQKSPNLVTLDRTTTIMIIRSCFENKKLYNFLNCFFGKSASANATLTAKGSRWKSCTHWYTYLVLIAKKLCLVDGFRKELVAYEWRLLLAIRNVGTYIESLFWIMFSFFKRFTTNKSIARIRLHLPSCCPGFNPLAQHLCYFNLNLNFDEKKTKNKLNNKPWSSSYGRRLVFRRSWVQNPSTLYWMDIFSHVFFVKIVMFIWGRGWPIKKSPDWSIFNDT